MVFPYVNIHTHERVGEGIEVVSAIALSESLPLPLPPFSIGIHPWQVGKVDIRAALQQVATAQANVIGEVGLDYAVQGDRELQTEVFRAQLMIAAENKLPVVLHSVRAFEPVMKILSDYTLPVVIFHGFVGSPRQAEAAVSKGYYLSFGEQSLRSSRTVEAMRSVPLRQIFFETDESALTITEIYRLAAEVLGVGVDELKLQIFENYIKVFSQ